MDKLSNHVNHQLLLIFSVEVGVPIQKLVEKLDMPEQNISTFMCYLEEHEKVTEIGYLVDSQIMISSTPIPN